MPGMMRSRTTGCTCCGDWVADRAVERRALLRWRDEYETRPVNVVQDECPLLHWPCPPDTETCCVAARVAQEA